MKPLKSLTMLVFSGLMFGACGDDDDLCLRGSGQVNEYPIEVASFSRVELRGPVNLMITQGPVQEVIVTAEPELFGPLDYEVRDGQLEIGYFNKNISCFDTDEGVWVNITVPNLTEIESEGLSIIRNTGMLSLPYLEMVMAGETHYELNGMIDYQEIYAEGLTDIRNFGVESSEVELVLTGSAEVEVTCYDELDITVEGSADVRYKGNPQITQSVDGSLNLVNAN